jgi:uncharacterized cofD-like protein
MDTTNNLKIVVIGGGTGSFTLLKGLKKFTNNLTAIVNMADDGGSTGALRDELGVLPPGDVRQCLVALSDSPKLRDLFNYRFDEGSLEGHAFGNLFLTALEKMTGNFAEAVNTAGNLLNVRGRVLPVTLDDTHLVMDKRDGSQIRKQFTINNMFLTDKDRRPLLKLDPPASINSEAAEAIKKADIVVIAPGSLYGSMAPALLVKGMGNALKKTKAKVIYVCNLITKPGQTDGFKVHDFASEIERFSGVPVIDAVLFNTKFPNKKLVEKYHREKEFRVNYDKKLLLNQRYKSCGASLVSNKTTRLNKADKIASSRAYIRHDPYVTAQQILKLYKSL